MGSHHDRASSIVSHPLAGAWKEPPWRLGFGVDIPALELRHGVADGVQGAALPAEHLERDVAARRSQDAGLSCGRSDGLDDVVEDVGSHR